jgi:hypothetical protein
VTGSAIHHDLIQRVLPDVSEFIRKRFEFLPSKKQTLLDVMTSFRDILLDRGGFRDTGDIPDIPDYFDGGDDDDGDDYDDDDSDGFTV